MIAEILVLIGSFILFSGALGVAIFKDAYQRFHAAGKVSLFGLAVIFIADYFRSLESSTPATGLLVAPIVVVLFGPLASHILARCLYFSEKGRQSSK